MGRAKNTTQANAEAPRGGGPERRPDRRRALMHSIDIRFERIPAQEGALRKVLEVYGEDFSRAAWNADFDSNDADAINRVHAVAGGFESIVNNLVEASSAAAKLIGIPPVTGQRSAMQNSLEALRQQGCFNAGQATFLNQAYTMTSLLRHASPRVDGDDLREQVQLLLRHNIDVVKALSAWLEKHDVDIENPG